LPHFILSTLIRPPPHSTLFPYTTLFRSHQPVKLTLHAQSVDLKQLLDLLAKDKASGEGKLSGDIPVTIENGKLEFGNAQITALRSEEHTSELQSLAYLVCRLLLEKKKKT